MFQSKAEKERKKKMLVRQQVQKMQRHIDELEKQKQVYMQKAKTAHTQGVKASYDLALNALKMTVTQQKRAQEMLLNFEITSQMRDMSMMTTEFLKSMGMLSKEMVKLTSEKQFAHVQAEFEKAMAASEKQTMNMELFLDESQASFSAVSGSSNAAADAELDKLIMEQVAQDEDAPNIDKELAAIREKLR